MSFGDFDGDGEFDASDAAILGGIFGYAEESMREEEEIPDEDLQIDRVDPSKITNIDLKILYNTDPILFNRVVEQAKKLNAKWAETAGKAISPESAEELKAIEDIPDEDVLTEEDQY